MDLIYRTFQFYRPYLTNQGELLNIWVPLNTILVEIPFFVFNFFVMAFCVLLDLLDQSANFIAQQDVVYELGKKIFNEFGGTGIAKGSLLSLFIIFSGIYLGYHFFAKNGQFTRKLMHYLAVIVIMFLWFAPIKTSNGSTQSGGLFIMKTVNTICTQVKTKATSVNFSFDGQNEEMNPKNEGFTKMYYQETIGRTFMFLNSGSYDGTLANGKKLEVDKLIPNKKIADSVPDGGVGLWDSLYAMISGDETQKEAVKWAKEREKYINDTAKVNSFMALTGDTLAYKLIATSLAVGDSLVLGFPVAYANLMLSIIQLLILVMLFLMPVVILLSFIPAMQNVLFKVCKIGAGLLFAPILLTLFLVVFFAVLRLINLAVMAGVDAIPNGVVKVLLATGSGGIIVSFLLLLMKFGVLRTFWKNKDSLMNLLTDGKYQAVAEIEQKAKDKVGEATDKVVGGAEVAFGMYTGNAQLAMDGAGRLMNDPQGKSNNFLDVGREHFVDGEANEFRSFSDGLDSWKHSKGFGEGRSFEEESFEDNEFTPTYEDVSLESPDNEYIDGSSYSDIPQSEFEPSNNNEEWSEEIGNAAKVEEVNLEEQERELFLDQVGNEETQEHFEVAEIENKAEFNEPTEELSVKEIEHEPTEIFNEVSSYETMETEKIDEQDEDIFK